MKTNKTESETGKASRNWQCRGRCRGCGTKIAARRRVEPCPRCEGRVIYA
jgi:rRNA maturation endonuclease Nob1